jgi:uncharacterized protein
MTFARLDAWRRARPGRGAHYHSLRSAMEVALGLAFRGDWPAKWWALYPGACRVRCVRHELALLPPSAAKLRLGFVSDLHIGPTTPPALLDHAFDELARAELDVLLLGGDYVFLDATEAKAERLRGLVARVPAARKVAVLGNHDLWTDHALLESALRAGGAEVLVNRSVTLPTPAGNVALIGLDEPWTGALDASRALRGVADAVALIALCHSPDGLPETVRALEALPQRPPGVFVCGHTHGGQIAMPWGPLVVPGRVGKRFPHGLYGLEPLTLYVSCGVGTTELPIRSFAHAEIVIIDVVSAAA